MQSQKNHRMHTSQQSEYKREEIQAMELCKGTHLVKLELLSNAMTMDSALNYIRNKQDHHQGQYKKRASDLTVDDDNNNNGKDQLTRGRQTIL